MEKNDLQNIAVLFRIAITDHEGITTTTENLDLKSSVRLG
jgi:hypothetical protein